MPIIFRGGLLPQDPNAPRVNLTPHLEQEAPALPESVKYYSKYMFIGMLGNDEWGDCVFAGDGHIVEQQSWADYKGTEDRVTTAEALRAYSVVTGFNPNAGPPGENPTDQGSTVEAGLDYLRKTGMAGFKIAAYGQVDVSNHTAVKRAIYEFGCLSIGMSVPESAMTQFNNGQPWTVVKGSPIEGGHCVVPCGYDADYVYVFTWGAVQPMAWEFWDTYVSEAHAPISADWASVSNLSLEAFGEEFVAVFGGDNPFNSPSPPATQPSLWARIWDWIKG